MAPSARSHPSPARPASRPGPACRPRSPTPSSQPAAGPRSPVRVPPPTGVSPGMKRPPGRRSASCGRQTPFGDGPWLTARPPAPPASRSLRPTTAPLRGSPARASTMPRSFGQGRRYGWPSRALRGRFRPQVRHFLRHPRPARSDSALFSGLVLSPVSPTSLICSPFAPARVGLRSPDQTRTVRSSWWACEFGRGQAPRPVQRSRRSSTQCNHSTQPLDWIPRAVASDHIASKPVLSAKLVGAHPACRSMER